MLVSLQVFYRNLGSISKLIPSTTLFERRLCILEMGAVVPVQNEREPLIQRAWLNVLGSKNGDGKDKGRNHTNQDALNLIEHSS